MITEAMWLIFVGEPAENDDLERANCPEQGKPGHYHCGWNFEKNLPYYMTGRDQEVIDKLAVRLRDQQGE